MPYRSNLDVSREKTRPFMKRGVLVKTRFEFCREKPTVRVDEEMLYLGFGENKPNMKMALTDVITLIRYLMDIFNDERANN